VRLVDTHCHLDSPRFDGDREQTIARALEAGVDRMMAIGAGEGPPDLEAGIRLAERYPFIVATVGVQPHDASKADDATWPRLRELAAHPKVAAIGEIGLEYHYDTSPRPVQRAVFACQLEIAEEAGKPVVIHTREAWEETMTILRGWRLGCILHCFTGDASQAEEALAAGFYLSFGGVLTFPKAAANREAARIAPAGRILIETDSPYLAPVPRRGMRNEPAFIVDTARALAALRGEPLEEVAAFTTRNWERLCLPAASTNG
jgi:TatD DNase family protein